MNETKKEVKRMFEGMLYHCMEMTNFMGEHRTDEYFTTTEGKKLMDLAAKICLYHSMGCLTFMADDIKEKITRKTPMDLEDILKSTIDGLK